MMMILSWTLKNWKLVLAGIAVAIIISLWITLQVYINKYQAEKAAKETVLALTSKQSNIIKEYENIDDSFRKNIN